MSGDGKDDCNTDVPVETIRDEIVGYGVTINGLPILEGDEATTLEPWYREHVMGGIGAFVLPANGFADFDRAIRQKFVVEISDLERSIIRAAWPSSICSVEIRRSTRKI